MSGFWSGRRVRYWRECVARCPASGPSHRWQIGTHLIPVAFSFLVGQAILLWVLRLLVASRLGDQDPTQRKGCVADGRERAVRR